MILCRINNEYRSLPYQPRQLKRTPTHDVIIVRLFSIPLDVVSPEIVTDVFTVNALGTLALYQAVKPLLEKSQAPTPSGCRSLVPPVRLADLRFIGLTSLRRTGSRTGSLRKMLPALAYPDWENNRLTLDT
ncbi:hypothetical protein ACN38_g1860 [Penicillium nordicum]|uniref:Uncharacterized protein n=1 Tax=Penicillium nordicum TaxID=229535 RepID=A0A0M9WJG5_9EURO|nr:hypothetical protein ACN38_g1860 [Penicillium nordicum]